MTGFDGAQLLNTCSGHWNLKQPDTTTTLQLYPECVRGKILTELSLVFTFQSGEMCAFQPSENIFFVILFIHYFSVTLNESLFWIKKKKKKAIIA